MTTNKSMMTETQRENPKATGQPLIQEAPRKNLERYHSLAYPVELVKDEDSYVASHPDLPGCISFGENPNEAVKALEEVKRLWIQGQIESGNSIPPPSDDEHFSGKFLLRIPKGLHRMADLRAKREGVSLNSYVANVLSGALGYEVPTQGKYESIGKSEHIDVDWCSHSVNPHVIRLHTPRTRYTHPEKKRELGSLLKFTEVLASRMTTSQVSDYVSPAHDEDYRAHKAQVSRK